MPFLSYSPQFFAACLFRAKVQVNHFGRNFKVELEVYAQIYTI